MYRQIFAVVEAPRLHLWECEGDVAIEGWEGALWLETRTGFSSIARRG